MGRATTLTAALFAVLVATLPAFSRVLTGTEWRGRYLAAGALALLLAHLVRRLGGNGVLALVVSVAGWVGFTYVTALPPVGLLPDLSSLTAARELFEEAIVALREEVAPTPAIAPFVAAMSTGAWLASHLAHELAVRFDRPGAGLVPFLVLWTLPLAVPIDGVADAWSHALPLLLTAGLVLLVGTDRGDDHARVRLPVTGLAAGAAALALATVAPAVLPGYDAAAWVDVDGGGAPRGYQPIVDVTERLQLPDERELLRVRASERTYLRLAGLDSFDGGTWRLGPAGEGSYRPPTSSLYAADGPLPPEEPALVTRPARVEVEVLDLANIYVPAPYQPVAIGGDLSDEVVWSTEGGFLATWSSLEGDVADADPTITEGVGYAVDAERPVPTIEQLRSVEVDDATRERWTRLPRGYPALADAAQQVAVAADATTDVDRALALQEWFTDGGGFTYDLDVPALRGDDALERFVLEDRVGYCEYFATAMAVMLRAIDVPARVAVGFLPGRVTEAADPEAGQPLTEYAVSTTDAHAWVEVLFPGYGWITFEPTPRDDQTQLLPTEADLAPVENLREQRRRELEDAGSDDAAEPTPETPDPVPPPETVAPQPAPAAGDDEAVERSAGRRTRVAAAAIVLVALATVLLRRRRDERIPRGDGPTERVLAAQRHLLTTAARYGIGRAPAETTREVVGRWHREGRTSADDGARFAGLAQHAAFGGPVGDDVAAEAEQLVHELEEQLRASVTTRDRLLAPARLPVDHARARARRWRQWASSGDRAGDPDGA